MTTMRPQRDQNSHWNEFIVAWPEQKKFQVERKASAQRLFIEKEKAPTEFRVFKNNKLIQYPMVLHERVLS